MSEDRTDTEELSALLTELSETLDRLGDRLESQNRRGPDRETPRRPPGPGELVRFTESYTIPTLISLLEAGVQSLELLQAALRVADGRPPGLTDREGRRRSVGGGERVGELSRVTMERLDELLSELGAPDDEERPPDPARELLEDARRLRNEVDDRLSEASGESGDRRRNPDAGTEIPVVGSETDAPAGDSEVDVEAELDTIRRDLRGSEDEERPSEDDPEE